MIACTFSILISIQSLIISNIIARTIPKIAITRSSSSFVATVTEIDRKSNVYCIKVCLRSAYYLFYENVGVIDNSNGKIVFSVGLPVQHLPSRQMRSTCVGTCCGAVLQCSALQHMMHTAIHGYLRYLSYKFDWVQPNRRAPLYSYNICPGNKKALLPSTTPNKFIYPAHRKSLYTYDSFLLMVVAFHRAFLLYPGVHACSSEAIIRSCI